MTHYALIAKTLRSERKSCRGIKAAGRDTLGIANRQMTLGISIAGLGVDCEIFYGSSGGFARGAEPS